MRQHQNGRSRFRRVRSRIALGAERGAAAIEYGILASLIAAVIIAAVFFLGRTTSESFTCTGDTIIARTNQC